MNTTDIDIIKQAIINEVEGYEFYRMASHQANSQGVKDTFVEFAAEELEHINWLKDFYLKIKEDKANEFQLGLLADSPSPKMFTWDNLDRKDAAIVLSVYGIGMQIEKAASEFYRNSSEKTEVMEAKELYRKLGEWEQTHLDQFSREYSRLTEEWRTEQGFPPF